MQSKMFRLAMMSLLGLTSLLASACTPPSQVDKAYGSAGGAFAPQGYSRTIFSTHNF